MDMTYVPSIPELAHAAIRKLTPFKSSEANWRLKAVGFSDSLFCWELSCPSDTGAESEVIVGIPTSVVLLLLPSVDEAAVQALWKAPDAYMTDLEQMSRNLTAGNHRLVISPIHIDGFGDITVTALYLQSKTV